MQVALNPITSTNHINHLHQPQGSVGHSYCDPKQEVALISSTTHFFWGPRMLRSDIKMLLTLNIIHAHVYCCVKDSKVEYQVENFKTYHQK